MGNHWHNLDEIEISNRLRKGNDTFVPRFADIPADSELIKLVPGKPRPAAVLIPLLRQENGWYVLFTRRNAGLTEHSGQVAFPGGRADPEDRGPEQTALREAYEEIGLNPADVRILGRLKDYITITNYRVTPVVGVIPWPYPIHPANDEVSHVFTIPLEWLANPLNREERLRVLPAPFSPIPVIYYHPFEGETLWGASARFVLALIETLEDR